MLRILTNSDGIPGTKRAMIKKQFYYIAERDIWQAHHQKICQILTCCTVPKKSFFCFSLDNTPKHYIEVWSVDDMAKDASTPFALLALHPTRPTLRYSVSKSIRNVSLSFYSQWYFFERFWASVMQSESGLATPLFPQSSVKINLTKNPILALDDAEISANLWRRFLLNSSYCKEMTFLCLIEIRFCFNGFAATFVFGGAIDH